MLTANWPMWFWMKSSIRMYLTLWCRCRLNIFLKEAILVCKSYLWCPSMLQWCSYVIWRCCRSETSQAGPPRNCYSSCLKTRGDFLKTCFLHCCQIFVLFFLCMYKIHFVSFSSLPALDLQHVACYCLALPAMGKPCWLVNSCIQTDCINLTV